MMIDLFVFDLCGYVPCQGFDPQGILDDMRKLKLIVKAHERRIKSLEEKLAQYESEEENAEDA